MIPDLMEATPMLAAVSTAIASPAVTTAAAHSKA
jgi:hypothetical protein